MAIQINGPDPAANDQVIDWLVQPLMSHRTSLKNPLHWEEASGGLQIACEKEKKKKKVHEKERGNNQDGGICHLPIWKAFGYFIKYTCSMDHQTVDPPTTN